MIHEFGRPKCKIVPINQYSFDIIDLTNFIGGARLSLVIAVLHEGVVYYGADSQTTSDKLKFSATDEEKGKIRILPQEIVIGNVGKVRTSSILWLHDEWFQFPDGIPFTKETLLERVVNPYYRELAKVEKDLTNESFGVKSLPSSFLIGHKDRVYLILGSGGTIRIVDYAAIGSGAEYALPALSDPRFQTPNERILFALRTAAKYEPTVSGPFLLFNSATLTPVLES